MIFKSLAKLHHTEKVTSDWICNQSNLVSTLVCMSLRAVGPRVSAYVHIKSAHVTTVT